MNELIQTRRNPMKRTYDRATPHEKAPHKP
jgi:hypothetical protein